jgi:lipoic acid synthetase
MRIPAWIVEGLREREKSKPLLHSLEEKSIITVCKEAQCPNIGTCFAQSTATFLIMGPLCTRNCTFCAVAKGKPAAIDPDEPRRIGEMVHELGMRHAVITSVTRDDLVDGGAGHFIRTIRAVRRMNADATIEVLIPDFNGNDHSLDAIISEAPEVINHNIETIRELYGAVRPGANFERSLALLARVSEKGNGIVTKSGMMVGLGETKRQIFETMDDLLVADVQTLTIGQYLRPTQQHHEVNRYVTPDEFDEYREVGLHMGFLAVASGPFVRSSFNAESLYRKVKRRNGETVNG